MKLKYWILILVVAATGVAGGVAISQEYDEPAAVSKNVAASSEFVQVCYSLAKDGKTFTEFDLDQLTTTATPGKCSGSLKQLTIPVMVP